MLLQSLGNGFDPAWLLSWLIAVTVAITIHEFSHAKRADLAGDPTPRAMGRLTLNPLAHYDLIGTTLFLLAGFGWAKPVPVNPLAFRHPRRDALMVALWGPLSNFLTAAAFALPVRLGVAGPYGRPLAVIVLANLLLGVFNLIPFGPLDGAHVLESSLSVRANYRLHAFYERHRVLLLIAAVLLLFVPPFSTVFLGIITWPAYTLAYLLLGPVPVL